MKKTLQEQKERFHQIIEQGATNMAYGFKPSQNDESFEMQDLNNAPTDKMDEAIIQNFKKIILQSLDELTFNHIKPHEARKRITIAFHKAMNPSFK